MTCPADVDPVICDAAAFVQRTRGRPFLTFPVIELLDDVAFEEALLADFEEYRDDLEVNEVLLIALGLLEPDVSLVDAYRSSLEIGVVGFYQPDGGRLVVRGAELDLYVQQVLVHELTHALDDQWFDLDRDDAVDDEAGYGFTAVVEGNASRVDRRWEAALGPAERADLQRQELRALSPEELQIYLSLPPVLQQLQASPYVDGARYVDHLLAQDGEAGVDRALTSPPTTSEEVLHPGLDRASDPEIDVEPPPAGGPVLDEGRLGELVVELWLGPTAADGWGGDRYVTWTEGDRSCVAVDLVGDDDVESAEQLEAAKRWAAEAADDRSVAVVTIDAGDGVRVTGCG
ncbi:MAG: hypothetical protein ACFCVK_15565 [Acidimicrobiales bacterium]